MFQLLERLVFGEAIPARGVPVAQGIRKFVY
jgi:hypothetical protein